MKTNKLVHTIDVRNEKLNCKVVIKLADDCKNGHEDFSVTATFWEPKHGRIDRCMITAGACHEEILKHFPELKQFVDLHLCDFSGAPMHPVSNMLYFIKNGFNSIKPEQEGFKQRFCDYYRLDESLFEAISRCEEKVELALLLDKKGVLDAWKKQAEAAIKELERLTGDEFESKATCSMFVYPTQEEIAAYMGKVSGGYCTEDAKNQREADKVKAAFDQLETERSKNLNSVNLEFDTKKAILTAGGSKALENCIYYNHTQTVKFNWRNYDNLPAEFIEQVKAKCILPDGVKFE